VLVGEILLQRTRGEHVEAVYEAFVHRWPDPQALSRARTSSIASVIRPLGLVKRAATLKELGAALATLGDVPTDPESLLRLPGVGPYAAHAVPVFTAGANLPVVDWVIARVLRRYFGLREGRRPNADPELWGLATDLADSGRARELWLGTLDFAAAVCKPRPLCPTCPLRSSCSYFATNAAPR
jgi:A/G-specific adenine glycosylase